MKPLKGKEYAQEPYKRFETALKHSRSFIQWKYNQDDIDAYALNADFVNDFSFWLRLFVSVNKIVP